MHRTTLGEDGVGVFFCDEIEALTNQLAYDSCERGFVTHQVDHILHPLLHANGSQIDGLEKSLLIPQRGGCLSVTPRSWSRCRTLFVDHMLNCLEHRICSLFQVNEILRDVVKMHEIQIEIAGFS